jgi:hypothetical protein
MIVIQLSVIIFALVTFIIMIARKALLLSKEIKEDYNKRQANAFSMIAKQMRKLGANNESTIIDYLEYIESITLEEYDRDDLIIYIAGRGFLIHMGH